MTEQPLSAVSCCSHVRLRFVGNPPLFDDLELELSRASASLITGATGAGKTSLLKLLHGALHPDSGTVTFLGRDLAKLARRDLALTRQRIGLVFQTDSLFDHLPVFDNVALPLRIMGQAETAIDQPVTAVLEKLMISDLLGRPAGMLSGGQRQLVAIARALIHRPSLVLADEPFRGVDEERLEAALDLMAGLNMAGTTIVITGQDPQLGQRLGLDLYHLRNRRLEAATDTGTASSHPEQVAC